MRTFGGASCPYCGRSLHHNGKQVHIRRCPMEPERLQLIRVKLYELAQDGIAPSINEYDDARDDKNLPMSQAIARCWNTWPEAMRFFSLVPRQKKPHTKARWHQNVEHTVSLAPIEDRPLEALRQRICYIPHSYQISGSTVTVLVTKRTYTVLR